MTKQEMQNWLSSKGYSPDAWGNYKLISKGRTFRFKLNKLAARLEIKTSYGEWRRVRSGYYKNLSIQDGKLSGLTT